MAALVAILENLHCHNGVITMQPTYAELLAYIQRMHRTLSRAGDDWATLANEARELLIKAQEKQQ